MNNKQSHTESIRVLDPRGYSSHGELTIENDMARMQPLLGPREDMPRRVISPGWVDLHAHVFDGSTEISVAPDRVGLDHGVHIVADAGSAGHASVDGLQRYVVPTSSTRVVSWLNIGSGGLITLRETADMRLIDVDSTVTAALARREFVRGIKVRSSGAIVGNMGLQPLQLGKIAARASGLPLMVHIGEAPPVIDDILDILDEGDSITHCFHGKMGHPWNLDGSPNVALSRALDRGVQLDVGHGAASFDIEVARAAISAGILPHTISTDIHVRNVLGPVYDMATVMTKMLACGMPLMKVVNAVTYAPRNTLGVHEDWIADDGEIRHATIFELRDQAPGHRHYIDAGGKELVPETHIVVIGTVVDGHVRYLLET